MRGLVAIAVIGLTLGTASCGDGDKDAAPTASTPPDTSLAYADDPTVRPAFRAGKDYPGKRVDMDNEVGALLDAAGDFEPRPAFAIVTPHAGLIYSGSVAAAAYARVEVPDTVILVSPKHHGEGASPALWDDGPFIVPGHAIGIRHDLVERWGELVEPDEVTADRAAFMKSENHPLENQLPFLTTINPDVQIVPFAIFDNSQRDFVDWDVERIERWGKALADLVREREAAGEEVLVVATTDLVHRIPLVDAEVQDARLMELIVGLDVQGLHDYVVDDGVTICGETVVAITMAAAVELGYSNVEQTGIGTSFPGQQNPDSVVGYGSVVIWPTE